ncbi:MAG: hypothetical protein AAF570_29005 [Bacteroidota bacterium]
MKIVQEHSLIATVERMDALDDIEAQALMERFAEKQPYVLGYIMAMEEDFDDLDDFQHLLQLVVTIWLAFMEEFGSLPVVREDQIEQKETRAIKAIQGMDNLTEDQMIEVALKMFEELVQPVLLQFVSDELISLEEEGALAKGEIAAGQMFPILKMIVELFDDAVNRPSMRIV